MYVSTDLKPKLRREPCLRHAMYTSIILAASSLPFGKFSNFMHLEYSVWGDSNLPRHCINVKRVLTALFPSLFCSILSSCRLLSKSVLLHFDCIHACQLDSTSTKRKKM